MIETPIRSWCAPPLPIRKEIHELVLSEAHKSLAMRTQAGGILFFCYIPAHKRRKVHPPNMAESAHGRWCRAGVRGRRQGLRQRDVRGLVRAWADDRAGAGSNGFWLHLCGARSGWPSAAGICARRELSSMRLWVCVREVWRLAVLPLGALPLALPGVLPSVRRQLTAPASRATKTPYVAR
jgi:hypothetical protein